MSDFSNYAENALIDATLRGVTYTGTRVYVALFTGDPTEDGTGPEVTDSAYARQDAADGGAVDSGWVAPVDGVTSNAKLVKFPAIADATITVTHYAIFDAATAGNMLYHSALTVPKTLDPTDIVSFDTGAITVTLQ